MIFPLVGLRSKITKKKIVVIFFFFTFLKKKEQNKNKRDKTKLLTRTRQRNFSIFYSTVLFVPEMHFRYFRFLVNKTSNFILIKNSNSTIKLDLRIFFQN